MTRKLLAIMLLPALFACTPKTQDSQAETPEDQAQEDQTTVELNGKWRLADCVGNDEILTFNNDESADYFIVFTEADHTFGMNTDCNSIGGEYKVVGDSIYFDNVARTQMACPDEAVEQAISNILPQVSTFTITPDSTLLLRADARTMASFKKVD